MSDGLNAVCVSFDDEQLVLVDADDAVTGHCSKAEAHRGDGLLHRAFSIFLFADADTVLLHRRAAAKPLWAGFWTNSVCSHPRRGESYAFATRRRLREELGVAAALQCLYRFEYHAAFADKGSEHELCSVFVGRLGQDQTVCPNPTEIAEWAWFDCAEVDRRVADAAGEFTPWFLLEWARLRGEFRPCVEQICSRGTVRASVA
ncbi:MAG: isopentenyl-diphosphate Delta-isomerase [Actinobacteria bacterium]|nr:isopentenyl-diphosphate Delta-isomerase [Actinomycetota bacterium]